MRRSAFASDVALAEEDKHALIVYHYARHENVLAQHGIVVLSWLVRSGLQHRDVINTLDARPQTLRIVHAERAPAAASHRGPGSTMPLPSAPPRSVDSAPAVLSEQNDMRMHEQQESITASLQNKHLCTTTEVNGLPSLKSNQ